MVILVDNNAVNCIPSLGTEVSVVTEREVWDTQHQSEPQLSSRILQKSPVACVSCS
jgi:hypothetical protein